MLLPVWLLGPVGLVGRTLPNKIQVYVFKENQHHNSMITVVSTTIEYALGTTILVEQVVKKDGQRLSLFSIS